MRKLYFILSYLLVVCSLNAQLYGTTSVGGKGGGTISVLDPVTTSLKTQFNFDTQEGEYAWYSRLIQATNGKLYGMTMGGGVGGFGKTANGNRGANGAGRSPIQ